MLRCNEKAYAQCLDHHLCGPIDAATFTEDSECAAFNRAVEERPMTNADYIRAMSDKELVEFVGHNSLCDRIQSEGTWCEEHAICENCLTVWLQQPMKEG